MNWQPIETAAKDGTAVLLYWPAGLWSVGFWDSQKYHAKPLPYWTCQYQRVCGVGFLRNNPPTHWCELMKPNEKQ